MKVLARGSERRWRKRPLLPPGQSPKVYVDGKVEPSLVNGATPEPARNIAEALADIGRSELDPIGLKRLRQEAERLFFYSALPGVGVGGLVVIGLFSGSASAAAIPLARITSATTQTRQEKPRMRRFVCQETLGCKAELGLSARL